MENSNYSEIAEFILVGFSEVKEIQLFLFLVFLLSYALTVLGNMTIIVAYSLTQKLHNPMYFCLSNFSFLDICYVSATVPKTLSNLLAEDKTISFYGCALQMYCVVLMGGTECYMLAAMAYDRYNAICHPLLYSTIMTKRACNSLIAGSWIIGALNSLIHTVLAFTLPFCSHEINHFFCDVPPLLKLSCTDTFTNEIVVFLVGGCVVVGSCILTILSYVHIISTILSIRSSSGRKKAFSTCTSHLTVVAIFYGSAIFMYFRPKSKYAKYQEKLVSIMYTIIAPMLNPFIYSLRNNDVKDAVSNVGRRIIGTHRY
ncbi:olfactory receptor 5V1-like [Spea bombifrons]|uniref:olfactory receptor 5V1-like n=1 Tax=Spea bombifrons TaxID=233779 RepID=UPI00234BECB0|nr:olfactory receptor 5V1-like [Spea bombifrons]